jgi:hypothetical protein
MLKRLREKRGVFLDNNIVPYINKKKGKREEPLRGGFYLDFELN